MVKTATVLQSALLLCVWGALAQEFMSPNVNIIEELGKLKNMEERLRTMEERLKTMEEKMQSQNTLVEQLKKENGALKTTVETMQAKLESLQSIKAGGSEGPAVTHVESDVPSRPVPSHGFCGDYPTIEHGDVIEAPDGLVLTVRCAALYKLEGPKEVRCVNRKWSDLPVCKAPCRLDQSKFQYPEKEYMQHGEQEGFYCRFLRKVQVKCENGRAYYRGCGHHEW